MDAQAEFLALLPQDPLHYIPKHLQQGIESDHFRGKKPMPRIGGFQSFHTARRTIRGFEAMLWLRKGFWFAGAGAVCEQHWLPRLQMAPWALQPVPVPPPFAEPPPFAKPPPAAEPAESSEEPQQDAAPEAVETAWSSPEQSRDDAAQDLQQKPAAGWPSCDRGLGRDRLLTAIRSA